MENTPKTAPLGSLEGRSKVRSFALDCLQLSLFSVALLVLVPVPASDVNHSFDVPVGLAITLFGLSRLMAFLRGRGGVFSNTVELLAFVGFAFVLPMAMAIK